MTPKYAEGWGGTRGEHRGVQVHFKGANTVKELLVAPEDKDNIIQKGEVI